MLILSQVPYTTSRLIASLIQLHKILLKYNNEIMSERSENETIYTWHPVHSEA